MQIVIITQLNVVCAVERGEGRGIEEDTAVARRALHKLSVKCPI